MLKANVDKIIEVLRVKKTISIPDLSKLLKLPNEDIQRSAEYLEEDGVVKIEYKLTTPYLALLRDPNAVSTENTQKPMQDKQQQVNNLQQPSIQQPSQQQNQQNTYGMGSKDQNNFVLTEPKEHAEPAQAYQGSQMSGVQRVEVQNLSINIPRVEVPKYEHDFSKQAEPSQEANPFDVQEPKFDLSTPLPDHKEEKLEIKYSLLYNESSQAVQREIDSYPGYVKTDSEKIDFLLDLIHKKLNYHDYKDLNAIYRKLYSCYYDSEDMSVNEKALLRDKIDDTFQRIKRIFLIENVV
jgi:hypothetical protein